MAIIFDRFQSEANGLKLMSPLTAELKFGDFVVLSAPSGSGKTKLIETLVHDLKSYTGKFVFSENIAAIFQTPDLCVESDVISSVVSAQLEQLQWYKSLFGFSKDSILEAKTNLQKLNLDIDVHKKIHYLSGGEKQRVAIARLLMSKRRIWILDEPVSQLDSESAIHCLKVIKHEAQLRKCAVLCVLHQENVANEVASKKWHWRNNEWLIS